MLPNENEYSLNGDMNRRVAVRTSTLDWQPSPSGTVWRKRLHLVGGVESGQVTSVVRYEKGARSHFGSENSRWSY